MSDKVAIAQIRVSTSKQAIHGTSYVNQEAEIIKYCKVNDIKLLKIFKENGEDAELFRNASGAALLERHELLNSLDFIRQNPQVNTFVFWKMDRFTRDIRDYVWFKDQLDKFKIKQKSVTEAFDDSTIEGEFWMYFAALQADKDRKDTIKKLSIGHVNRFKEGYWLAVPPLGYMKDNVASNKCRRLVPDPKRYPLLKMAFEKFLTGEYSQKEILDWLNENGFKTRAGKKLSSQTLSRVFHDLKYTGYIEVKNRKSRFVSYDVGRRKAEWYEHRMIEYEDWFKLKQNLMNNKFKKNLKMNTHNSIFLLGKLLKCSKCGATMSGYLAKGIPYYKCHKPKKDGHDHFKADQVETAILLIMEKLKVSEEFIIGFERFIRTELTINSQPQYEMAKVYEDQLESIQRKIEKIGGMVEEGIYTIDQGKKRKKELEEEYLHINNNLQECFKKSEDADKIVENARYCFEHMGETFNNIEPRSKAKILLLFFPHGIVWKGGLSNVEFSPVINYIWSIREDVSHMARYTGELSNLIDLVYKEQNWFKKFREIISTSLPSQIVNNSIAGTNRL